jgi:hypothetical protein
MMELDYLFHGQDRVDEENIGIRAAVVVVQVGGIESQ